MTLLAHQPSLAGRSSLEFSAPRRFRPDRPARTSPPATPPPSVPVQVGDDTPDPVHEARLAVLAAIDHRRSLKARDLREVEARTRSITSGDTDARDTVRSFAKAREDADAMLCSAIRWHSQLCDARTKQFSLTAAFFDADRGILFVVPIGAKQQPVVEEIAIVPWLSREMAGVASA